MIFVNFKTYEQGTGQRAVDLVHKLCDCQGETGVPVIPVVQAVDLRICVEASDHEVWVQHVDPVGYGKHTGWSLSEAMVEAGAKGSFLNHSEHKFQLPVTGYQSPVGQLSDAVKRCREVGLKAVVFADSVEEAKRVAEFKPDYVAYEPPELVGSRTTSVASAKPEVIESVVKALDLPVIVGAGIHSKEDVEISLKLGAVGIAVATDIVLAEDPYKELLELAAPFTKK